ncbi:MAG: DUF58 domain-containing protein, partial [Bacillota bacterium]
MSVLALLAVTAALILLQGFVVGRWALRGLSYERRFSQTEAYAGQEVQMIEVIKNRKLLPVPWVKAESHISPHLRFQSDDELKISGERYH